MFDELEEEPRVDLTPLIDVIFMLVIFFVMTMTFSKPVLDVVLPAAQNSEVKKKDGGTRHQREVRRKVFL